MLTSTMQATNADSASSSSITFINENCDGIIENLYPDEKWPHEKGFKSKLLRVLRMDVESSRLRKDRRESVQRVALGNNAKTFTIPLKCARAGKTANKVVSSADDCDDQRGEAVGHENASESKAQQCTDDAEDEASHESNSQLDDNDAHDCLSALPSEDSKVALASEKTESSDIIPPHSGTIVPSSEGRDFALDLEFSVSASIYDRMEDLVTGDGSDIDYLHFIKAHATENLTEVSEANDQGVVQQQSYSYDDEQIEGAQRPFGRQERSPSSAFKVKKSVHTMSSSCGTIKFNPAVQVINIPRVRDYPRSTRKKLWGGSLNIFS